MISIGNRIVSASFALNPLGLNLLVSRDEFVVTPDPDDPAKAVLTCQSIEQVEEFIADYLRTGAPRPALATPRMPHVAEAVHYVSHGSPVREDGTQAYTSQCRAAIIAEIVDIGGPYTDPEVLEGLPSELVTLCVLNPTGLFFHDAEHDEDERRGGTWHRADHA